MPVLIAIAVLGGVFCLLAFTVPLVSGSLRLKRFGWLWFICGTALLWLGMRLWNRAHAKEWSAPDVSPDGRFEIRYFRVSTLRQLLPVTPGNGSDNAEGFVKLYDRRSGKALESVYLTNLNARAIFWHSTEVLIQGEDAPTWKLAPESAVPQR